MIGSHYSESGGGMYVEIGKCALGKYQEEDMTLLCRRHTLLRASWKMKQWDSLVCQKGWSFCNHFIFTWQRASYSLSPKDRSKRFSSYSPKGSSTGLLRPIWLVSSHFLLRTLCRPNLIYAHTALDTPDVVEAEVLSIFYAHLVLGHLIRCCHDPDCQRVLEERKKSLVPLLPRLANLPVSATENILRNYLNICPTSFPPPVCIYSTSSWLVGCSRHLRSL